MRFGLFGGARTEIGDQVSDSHNYTEYVDYICEAEALGFHSVFLVEHHFTGFGQVSATLSFLTYLAAKTTTLRLGTAVLVVPWHNPALLAEQAATLDLLSNGRFDFGIGKGYRWGEFHGFCIPMQEAEERYQETVAFLRKAWTTPGPLFASRQILAFRGCRHRAGAGAEAAPAIMDRRAKARPRSASPPRTASTCCWVRAAARRLWPRGSRSIGGQSRRRAGCSIRRRSGCTRALHIAMNDDEREKARELRAKFMATCSYCRCRRPANRRPWAARARCCRAPRWTN